LAASATLITFRPSASTFLAVAEPGRRRHDHVLHAGIGEVERVGAALRPIAYDRDLLVQDAGNVGVAVVVDAHDRSPRTKKAAASAQWRCGKAGGVKRFFARRSSDGPAQARHGDRHPRTPPREGEVAVQALALEPKRS
jgi:hypothetical protein